MSNDIEIRVRVSNQTAAGFASVNNSMRDLRNNARDAGSALTGLNTRAIAAAAGIRTLDSAVQGLNRSLRTMRGRAAAADSSLRDLRTAATGAGSSFRTLNTRAQTADGRLGDLSTRTRTLRGDMDDLDVSLRRVGTNLRGMRGGINLGRTSGSAGDAGSALEKLKKAALLLSPALIPVAAQAVPIVATLGAAALAAGAFGAALAGQLSKVKDAAEAEKKYNEAVAQHGRSSDEASKASAEYTRLLSRMDPATRKAAVALSLLKAQYQGWSKSLAGDTMPVVTKSFALFGAMLPRLTPMVRGASDQLDRLMNVAAGGMQSAGFDRFMKSAAEFSQGALARMTSGLVKLTQSMNTGEFGGSLTKLMDYARANGPAVGETFANLGRAMMHLVAAAADTGVGLLTITNALSKLVSAIPTGVLSNLMQLYVGMRLVKAAAGGLVAVTSAAALARLGAFFTLMRVAGVGTTLSAAAASMTRFQKAAVGLGVLGVAVLGIGKLAEKARGAPPDVDKLTTSLKQLANTGKFTGELQKTFGDLDGLVEKVKKLDSATAKSKETAFGFRVPGLDDAADKIAGAIDDIGRGENSLNALKDDFKGLDEAMAGMVSGGNAKQASSDFKTIESALRGAGKSTKDINALFPKYREGMTALKAENEQAARGMGLFGAQAIAVQQKLAAQKASADGLRQSILALNEAHRAAFDSETRFEGAIDNIAKSLEANGRTLDVNTEKGRANRDAFSQLAAATEEAASKALDSGAGWRTAMKIYGDGRKTLMDNAMSITHNREEAAKLVDQLLKTPKSKTLKLQLQKEQAVEGLNSVIRKLKATPGSKSVTVKALSGSAIKALESVGFKVKRLPDGRLSVTARTGTALSNIRAVQGARDRLSGKSITITTRRLTISEHVRKEIRTTADAVQRQADSFRRASGGPVRRLAAGGAAQHFPSGGLIQGPGTPTSDSIRASFASGAVADVSTSEYVVQARAVQRYGVRFLDALNEGRLKVAGLKKGGLTKAQRASRARAAARQRAERAREAARVRNEARGQLRDQFGISHFGRKASYRLTPFEKSVGAPSDLGSLVSSLNATRGSIKRATTGGTERRLLRALDSAGRGLIRHEKALSKVNHALDKAKDKLNDLKSSASQLRESVRSNVLSSASITRGQSDGKAITVASVMGGLVQSRDKASAFAGALSSLRKKGLDKGLLRQIAESGIEGGGLETAGALLRGSSSEIKSMNSLQAQIAKSALSAGKSTADAFYGAAIKAQEKLVKNLQKSQDRLEKAMVRLAKSIERTISRGIRGRKAAGGIVGAAASGGVRGGLTWVGEHEPELLDLPVGSRVRSGPDSRRLAAGASAASSGRPIVINLSLGGRDFGQLWIDTGRREVRTRGGNVQAALMGA